MRFHPTLGSGIPTRSVPTERPIELRARLRDQTERKLFVEFEARLGDALLATAEANFVLLDPEPWSMRARELLGE